MLLVLLVALVVVNAFAACGGGDDKAKRAAAARERIRESASPLSAVNRNAAEHLRRYFKNYLGGGYGQPKHSVYGHIKSTTVERGAATVKTDLRGGTRARRRADEICIAIETADQDILEARVTNSVGRTLRKCLTGRE